jgi:hypothetical protein
MIPRQKKDATEETNTKKDQQYLLIRKLGAERAARDAKSKEKATTPLSTNHQSRPQISSSSDVKIEGAPKKELHPLERNSLIDFNDPQSMYYDPKSDHDSESSSDAFQEEQKVIASMIGLEKKENKEKQLPISYKKKLSQSVEDEINQISKPMVLKVVTPTKSFSIEIKNATIGSIKKAITDALLENGDDIPQTYLVFNDPNNELSDTSQLWEQDDLEPDSLNIKDGSIILVGFKKDSALEQKTSNPLLSELRKKTNICFQAFINGSFAVTYTSPEEAIIALTKLSLITDNPSSSPKITINLSGITSQQLRHLTNDDKRSLSIPNENYLKILKKELQREQPIFPAITQLLSGIEEISIRLNSHQAMNLAKALINNNTLKCLDLSYKPKHQSSHIADFELGDTIENKGAIAIANLLKNNTTLQILNLSGNRIKLDGLNAIINVLKINNTLKKLDISVNPEEKSQMQQVLLALTDMLLVNTTLESFCFYSPYSCTVSLEAYYSLNEKTTFALKAALRKNVHLLNLGLSTSKDRFPDIFYSMQRNHLLRLEREKLLTSILTDLPEVIKIIIKDYLYLDMTCNSILNFITYPLGWKFIEPPIPNQNKSWFDYYEYDWIPADQETHQCIVPNGQQADHIMTQLRSKLLTETKEIPLRIKEGLKPELIYCEPILFNMAYVIKIQMYLKNILDLQNVKPLPKNLIFFSTFSSLQKDEKIHTLLISKNRIYQKQNRENAKKLYTDIQGILSRHSSQSLPLNKGSLDKLIARFHEEKPTNDREYIKAIEAIKEYVLQIHEQFEVTHDYLMRIT